LGLILGLTIKRRRVFVRVRPATGPAGADGGTGGLADSPATVVTIGGLSKDSDPGLAAIVTGIVTAINGATTTAEPDRPAERTES
jgi:cytochrome c biogenesis protein